MKNYSKTMFGIAAGLFLSMFAITANAQKAAVTAALAKHGISESILEPVNSKAPQDVAFDLKQSTITDAKTNILIAKFDPAKSDAERWTIVSVDGKTPSKSDINTFRNNHMKPDNVEKVDESTLKVEQETADQLVISYKKVQASLPRDATFIKDCRFYLTINLRTKQMDKLQVRNEKSVRIRILNAEKLEINTSFTHSDDGKRSFPLTETLTILAKFMGQAVNVQTISEYSNYGKK